MRLIASYFVALILVSAALSACTPLMNRVAPELVITENPYENIVRGGYAHRGANDLIRAFYAKCIAAGKSEPYCQNRFKPAAKYTRAMLEGLESVSENLAIQTALSPEQTTAANAELKKAQTAYWFALGALMHLTGGMVEVPIDWGDGRPSTPPELLEQP